MNEDPKTTLIERLTEGENLKTLILFLCAFAGFIAFGLQLYSQDREAERQAELSRKAVTELIEIQQARHEQHQRFMDLWAKSIESDAETVLAIRALADAIRDSKCEGES